MKIKEILRDMRVFFLILLGIIFGPVLGMLYLVHPAGWSQGLVIAVEVIASFIMAATLMLLFHLKSRR